MFKLVAEAYNKQYKGVVSSKSFETVEEAEAQMRKWARFGVDNLCDEADSLCIYDDKDALVSTWSRRQKRPVPQNEQPPAR